MSAERYDHKTVEEKRLKIWEDAKLFQKTYDDPEISPENKMYLLFAFAYPSGEGLHVGHAEPNTALDIMARYYRMTGKKVFFPVGWDAFGLPAEKYAVKTGTPPAITTKRAIANFTKQLKRIGISYDWESEVTTCFPDYYKWTQWLFLELYKAGKAYKDMAHVNWCPQDKTVLANEQVVNGRCDICGTEVIQKELAQWQFKITDYKDELISGLDKLDWPEFTKRRQVDWIGRKEGIEITYDIENSKEKITVFTTRPDTNFGATFIVIAPEHEFAKKVAEKKVSGVSDETSHEVSEYIKTAESKTELERQQEGKVKTGAFTGFYAINNLNGRKMPIWVSDFVLVGFGTGAVVGVPGHDKRDFQFAITFGLDIMRVILTKDGDTSPIEDLAQVQEEDGVMIDSDFLNGKRTQEAIEAMMDYLEMKGWGKRVTTYRLRDWLVSRQRYWGAPIPIVYDPEGKPHMVKEEHLPWILPTDVDFNPTGESPLTSSKEFKERVEKLYGKGWRPEYDTMDTFVDSSWYYFRYTDPKNEKEFASKEQMNKLLPVDFYMIGPEHTVLHLLYSRFFTKFLRDQGYLKFDEPFMKMRHQGMILGPDNKKMSKSKGNVINPDDVIGNYGADTLRVYEMFMGPIDADKPWDTNGVAGVHRFLSRAWNLANDSAKSEAKETSKDLEHLLHKTIKKVSADIPALKFNTAISQLMIFVNEWEKVGSNLNSKDTLAFLKLLAPFAPFMADEIYSNKKGKLASIHLESWVKFDEKLAQDASMTIVIQINGKLKAALEDISPDESEESIKSKAKTAAAKHLEGKEVVKTIYVPNKLVNFVVKDA